MNIKDFLGKVVFSSKTKTRYILTEITASYIVAKKENNNSSGHPSHYMWKTINGDPITNGTLVFEDSSFIEPFKKAYMDYCHSQDAYWEEYGYWMRMD